MIYVVKINDKEYDVEVEKGKANILKTTVVTTPIAAQKTDVPSASVPAITNVKGQVVKSPMPGTIMDIKVNPGDSVKTGDVLLILEAMKMENEIVAPVDGVIGQVLVTKGKSVITDDALISIQ